MALEFSKFLIVDISGALQRSATLTIASSVLSFLNRLVRNRKDLLFEITYDKEHKSVLVL